MSANRTLKFRNTEGSFTIRKILFVVTASNRAGAGQPYAEISLELVQAIGSSYPGQVGEKVKTNSHETHYKFLELYLQVSK